MRYRFWTEEENAFLREHYSTMPKRSLAERLQRTIKGIGLQAMALGLTRPTPRVSKGDKRRIKQLATKGWCNACIGQETNHARQSVRKWRKKLGLPPIAAKGMTDCPVCKERTRQTTKEQCRKAGVRSLAEIRSLVLGQFATEFGWPAGLPARCVQILELLAVHGPMTRRELCEAMGNQWISSRKAFKGNANLHGGSYMTHLMHVGLVACLGKPVRSNPVRRGGNVGLYSLTPLAIEIHKEHHERKERDAIDHAAEYADAGGVATSGAA